MNGGGKTTSIAKVAKYLMGKKYSVVLAAGDTFRAASIEQLEHHADRLGAKIIKHGYGADSASVIFDARKHAESRGIDVVLADTAGRTHVNENLMDELRKVMRVNKPELKILVVDSLTGNDAVEQAKLFDAGVGVDCVIMTKADVYEKGGSILSVSYAIKKPILFLGTGQGYDDLQKFEPGKFVKELME
jgi:fused signal recognition particle receptor